MKKILIIGNGKIAVDCARIVKNDNELVGIVTEPLAYLGGKSLSQMPDSFNPIEAHDINKIAHVLKDLRPDVIFSINNFQLIKDEILGIPPLGVINFHNGPLPKYAGLNVCSWAIINGETEHGVTWHYVDKGVDSGNIIAQSKFSIEQEENALHLIMKCIKEGIKLFSTILPEVTKQRVKGIAQDTSQRTAYKKSELPNNGKVSFAWNGKKVYNFIRGLNFDPLENNFVRPHSLLNNTKLYIDQVEVINATAAKENHGMIVACDGTKIVVQANDAQITLKKVRDDQQKPLSISECVSRYKMGKGSYLT